MARDKRTSRNEFTGDYLVTKPQSNAYDEGYALIDWGKDKTEDAEEKREDDNKNPLG